MEISRELVKKFEEERDRDWVKKFEEDGDLNARGDS